MQLCLDVANVEEWGPQTVNDLYRAYDIVHTLAGSKKGYEQFFEVRDVDGFFYHEGFEEIAKERKEEGMNLAKFSFLPGDDGYKAGLKSLRSFQLEIREFLDRCTRGKMDVKFINDFLEAKKIFAKIDFLPNDKDQWNPINNTTLNQDTFEEWVMVHEIIYPIIRHEGEQFSRVKRCPQCDKFFLGKSGKATYCSDVCSKRAQRDKPKQKFSSKIVSLFA